MTSQVKKTPNISTDIHQGTYRCKVIMMYIQDALFEKAKERGFLIMNTQIYPEERQIKRTKEIWQSH